jgi:cell division protein FtsB
MLYDISRTSIITWLREYRSRHGSQEVNEQTDVTLETMARLKKKEEMTELEKLQYENLRLRAEIDLLKKVKALVEERERLQKEIGRKPSAD